MFFHHPFPPFVQGQQILPCCKGVIRAISSSTWDLKDLTILSWSERIAATRPLIFGLIGGRRPQPSPARLGISSAFRRVPGAPWHTFFHCVKILSLFRAELQFFHQSGPAHLMHFAPGIFFGLSQGGDQNTPVRIREITTLRNELYLSWSRSLLYGVQTREKPPLPHQHNFVGARRGP